MQVAQLWSETRSVTRAMCAMPQARCEQSDAQAGMGPAEGRAGRFGYQVVQRIARCDQQRGEHAKHKAAAVLPLHMPGVAPVGQTSSDRDMVSREHAEREQGREGTGTEIGRAHV